MEIIIASHNGNKVREIREMLRSIRDTDFLSLHHFPKYVAPEETETTFEGNALLKARHAAKELNKWVLADDSGLVVPRLQGAPGVYSRRYSGENATDLENRRKLLIAMKDFTGIERSAYFECCLALCSPDGYEKCVTGICEGHILTEERGRNGFGYDALFVKHGYDKTFAEISDDVKSRISHRYKAFEKLILILETLKY